MKKLILCIGLFLTSCASALENSVQTNNVVTWRFSDNSEIKLDKKYLSLSKTLSTLCDQQSSFEEAKTKEIEITLFSKQEVEQVISLLPQISQTNYVNLVEQGDKDIKNELSKKTEIQ